jgi:hypothetical protein
MKWDEAVKKSPYGLAVALTEQGHSLRLMNASKEIFKIESPQGRPEYSSNTSRAVGRLNWQPVEAPLVRFTRFEELMEIAKDPKKELPDPEPEPDCELHEGQRGLQAMMIEWHERLRNLLGHAGEVVKTGFDDPELANRLEAISAEALAMRELL